jgi:hypothetical protein
MINAASVRLCVSPVSQVDFRRILIRATDLQEPVLCGTRKKRQERANEPKQDCNQCYGCHFIWRRNSANPKNILR